MHGVPLSPEARFGTAFLEEETWPADGTAMEWCESPRGPGVRVCRTGSTRNFAGVFHDPFSLTNARRTAYRSPVALVDRGIKYARMSGTGARYDELTTSAEGLLRAAEGVAGAVRWGRALAPWEHLASVPVLVYDKPTVAAVEIDPGSVTAEATLVSQRDGDLGGGTVAWTDLENAVGEDGLVAQAAEMVGSGESKTLVYGGFDFTEIPSGATIVGIVAEFKGRGNITAYGYDRQVQLARDGVGAGENRATEDAWQDVLTWREYGGAEDDWGAGLTREELVGGSLGLLVAVNLVLNYAEIDCARVTVHYR